MNCNPQNRLNFIQAKMRDWADVARNTNDKWVRDRARKNLANLIKQHPGVAEKLGYSNDRQMMPL